MKAKWVLAAALAAAVFSSTAWAMRLGDYVGKHAGKITEITKECILVVEIRPDGNSYKEVPVKIPVPKHALHP